MPLLPKFLRSTLTRMQTAIGGDKPANAEANPDSARSAEPQQDDSARFAQASAFHQRGQLDEAEALFRALLEKYPKDFDLLHRLGMIQGQRNNFEAAMGFIEQALAVEPNHASAHNTLGNCLKGLGRHEAALASYERALALQPNDADTLNNRGATLRDLKRPEDALASFERALAINPGHVLALDNRGMCYRDLNQPAAALACFDQVIAANPDYAAAHHNRGLVLASLKRYKEALGSYDVALRLESPNALTYYNRAIALSETGLAQNALESCNRALEIHSGFPQALCLQGDLLSSMKQYEAALNSYDSALKIQPAYTDALLNKSTALTQLKRHRDALAACEEALSVNPDNPQALAYHGAILRNLGRHEEALGSYERGLKISPDDVELHSGFGVVLFELKRFDRAMESYDRAAELNSKHAESHFNLALSCLHLGDFRRGWLEYEWRWQTPQFRDMQLAVSAPLWNGQKLDGDLLIWNEQGIGDEIFHSGMLNDLRPHARSITVCVDPRLIPLYQRSFKGLNIISRQMIAGGTRYSAQTPMGSLGRYLRPDINAFPDSIGPYLLADTQRAKALRSRLTSSEPLICGISWFSKNPAVGDDKSLRLMDLESVLALPGINFVNLQYGDTATERSEMLAATGLKLSCIDEIDNFNDIDGLAALIAACDIVVTVSNTTAHLAAALGRPVWVMLPYSRGSLWQWHADTERSPWYPSVRLLRQSKRGNWSDVIKAVCEKLSAFQSSPNSRTKT